MTGEEKRTEFRIAMASAVEWFRANCDPHQRIIIDWRMVELVGGEMAFPVEPVD